MKYHAIRCADYVLSQDCERDAEMDSLEDAIEHSKLSRYEMRIHVQNSVWYSALCIRDGKREAQKAVTELIDEVLNGN